MNCVCACRAEIQLGTLERYRKPGKVNAQPLPPGSPRDHAQRPTQRTGDARVPGRRRSGGATTYMTSHGPLPPPPRPVAHCARPTHCAAIDSALRALHSAYQRLDTKRGTSGRLGPISTRTYAVQQRVPRVRAMRPNATRRTPAFRTPTPSALKLGRQSRAITLPRSASSPPRT